MRGTKYALEPEPFDAEGEEEVDPGSSLTNMSDVMLVLALALMVALVNLYGIDLSTANLEKVEVAEQVENLDDVETITEMIESEGSGYTELGTVYQDPETGEMYMLEPEGGN